MKNQKYSVRLTSGEQKELKKIVRSKTAKELTKQHAKVLLYIDENRANPFSVNAAAQKAKLHPENVYKIRKQFVLEGMDRALKRKKRETPPVPAKVTGEVEAHIIATACSEVPEGKAAWTLKMIGNKIVLDGLLESVSDSTIGRVLKKRN